MIVYKLVGAHADYPAGVYFDSIEAVLEEIKECLECYVTDAGEQETYTIEAVEMTLEQFESLEEM